MFLILQVVSVLLTSVAMALALAHALELPGKLRLDRDEYLVVQRIYYPGFTLGGVSEVLGSLALLGLLLATPADDAAFGWTLAALGALAAMHAVYWLVTHPVNRFWLKDQPLADLGAGFFGIGGPGGDRPEEDAGELWKRYRNRWELSHVARAALGLLALTLLAVAVAL